MPEPPYDRLDQELSAMRGEITFPATPNLAAAVRRRIDDLDPDLAAPPRRWPLALLAAAVAALLLTGAVLALSGDVRDTVADRLGLGGIRIVFDSSSTPVADPGSVSASPTGTPIAPSLLLGRPVSLASAQGSVFWPILVPATLGEPDEVYLRQLPGGESMVSLVYHARADLPQTAETGLGLLLMQFSTESETAYLVKELYDDGRLTTPFINGSQGYWIEGASRLLMVPDPASTSFGPLRRPSGNILLWAQDGVTFRMETSLSKSESLAIAASLAATPEP